MNVTPMIDVLLVLIIIFMVILPHKSEGLNTRVPQQSTSTDPPPAAVQQDVVLTVEGDGHVLVNQDAVGIEGLEERLKAIFKITARPVVFVRADGSLAFKEVAEVIDVAKGVGFTRVALMK